MTIGPAVILWDFGDTLVDERWMQRAPADCPSWPDAWTEVMNAHADAWNVGTMDRRDIVHLVGARAGMSDDEANRHAYECCQQIILHSRAWGIATERRRPQAIVTVNPDLFVDWVVPALGLTKVFDVVVVSAVEHTADKTRLCEIALDRLGYDGSRRNALLIDNRRDLIEAWRATGGSGYWFEGDMQFAADVDDLLG